MPPTLTVEEIDSMSIKDMKAALRDFKIAHNDCLTKADLIARLKEQACGQNSRGHQTDVKTGSADMHVPGSIATPASDKITADTDLKQGNMKVGNSTVMFPFACHLLAGSCSGSSKTATRRQRTE